MNKKPIPRYLDSDMRSLEMHRIVAERLRQNPLAVMAKARENITRWLVISPGIDYAEWTALLDKGPEAVLAALESETDDGQRLRSSSPFVGVLNIEERNSFFRKPKF